MKITNEQRLELQALARPLQQWMNDNCHLHVKALVDSETMEFMEGLTSTKRTELDGHPEKEG